MNLTPTIMVDLVGDQVVLTSDYPVDASFMVRTRNGTSVPDEVFSPMVVEDFKKVSAAANEARTMVVTVVPLPINAWEYRLSQDCAVVLYERQGITMVVKLIHTDGKVTKVTFDPKADTDNPFAGMVVDTTYVGNALKMWVVAPYNPLKSGSPFGPYHKFYLKIETLIINIFQATSFLLSGNNSATFIPCKTQIKPLKKL